MSRYCGPVCALYRFLYNPSKSALCLVDLRLLGGTRSVDYRLVISLHASSQGMQLPVIDFPIPEVRLPRLLLKLNFWGVLDMDFYLI